MRVIIAIVLGLLGFAFPILFIPAALIFLSAFEDKKAPRTNRDGKSGIRNPTQASNVRPAEAIAKTGKSPPRRLLGQPVNPAVAAQSAWRALTPEMREKISQELDCLDEWLIDDHEIVDSRNVELKAITPAGFLRKFGIAYFYHFTDTRNLASIRSHGGLLPWSQVKGRVAAPGGNDWSHDADAIKGQDQYVHLCFFPEHPMEFTAKRDGRILESRFLRIDTSIIHTPGILFCPDVGNKSGVPMLTLPDAVAQMDFEIISPAYNRWLDPPLFERKKIACKYEILVPCKIPLSLISGL